MRQKSTNCSQFIDVLEWKAFSEYQDVWSNKSIISLWYLSRHTPPIKMCVIVYDLMP